MEDLPCRIAQAHTVAEQARKWDKGETTERKRVQKETKKQKYSATLPPPK